MDKLADNKMINKIEKLLQEARTHVADEVNNTLLRTYMEIGKLLIEDINLHENEENYQNKTISMLSKFAPRLSTGQPGADPDLGSIHWKLSSKLDNLIVREFAYPANYSVLILYDVMKHTDGTVIDTERNNAVLALTAALSESLIRMGLEHTVGSIAGGDYQDLPVYSMETQEQMVYHLLYRPVAEKRNTGDTMYHFLRSNLKNTYTKLVYITPEYEESVIRQAAREVNLTMIPVVSQAESSYVDAREYTVLPVDAEKYREQIHHMII